jgi:DNA sulfur modification protein DndC
MTRSRQPGLFGCEVVATSTPEQVIEEIRKRLQEINLVSFSGGKDSTVVLRLVLEALRGSSGRRLYIVTADTRMEIPYFQDYVNGVRRELEVYLEHAGINAEVVTVRPPAKDSFWVSVLGMGYPAAHMGFRWCTGKLKIDPITRFTKTVTKDTDYAVFVGVRSAESELRARIYRQKDYKPNHFAPILDWSADDVWTYLMGSPCPWGDHAKLIEVYRYSSDECVYGEKQGVCIGNARYGCWACPLQKSMQLEMIGHNTGDERYLLLKSFKETLVGMANNRSLRSVIRRNGEVGAGPFLVTIRRRLFGDLRELERRTGWTFVTADEEKAIRRHWEKDRDRHNVGDKSRPLLWNLEEARIC